MGSFIVRSAYHLAKELSTISKAESSRRSGDMHIWQGIWSLKMANAGKNFMWRACHNLLLTMNNLVRRKIVDDPKCPICRLEAETIFHILWACPLSMDVWSVGLRLFQKFVFPAYDFLQLVEGIFQKSQGNEFAIFVEIARKIWFHGNKWIHDGLFTPPNEVSRPTHATVEDYKRCNDPKNEEEVDKEMEMKWTRPPQGWYKINCDAAVDAKN